MRALICLITILFVVSVASAQGSSEWREFRSDADGFSIEFPGIAETSSRDLSDGQTQKLFIVTIGSETYLASVIQLNPGSVPANPDQAYFDKLMKGYTGGSKTTLQSSRMFTWVGRAALEGIAEGEGTTHVIDLTTTGDRIYLLVYAGAKGSETAPKATHLRDSFKLLGK
jgi:hypothetical protein